VENVAATCTDRPERIPQPTVKRDALEGPEVPTEFTARTVNVYTAYRVRGPTDTLPASAGKD
jgi:hypothetical protein